MAPSKFSDECKELFSTADLYSVLGLDAQNANSLTEKEIKRAYYKCSLKYHPDRVRSDDASADDVQLATKRFQLLGKAYAILSDPDKKKLYDDSGIIDEEEGGADEDRDWEAYWRLLFKKVTVKDVENFMRKYKDSQEELDDLKLQYMKHEGDLELIYGSAFCANAEEDRERIRARLQQLIDQGELQHFPKFDVQETEAQKKRRQRKAKKEATEAKQLLKDIMGKEEMNERDLRNAIQARRANNATSLIQRLEEKYCGGSGSNKSPAAKKQKRK